MFFGDVHLLVFGVTGEIDHFHTVKKRRRNVVAVAGGHKHDVRQIKVQIEVVILEGAVLFRIEHFKQRRRRVTAVVAPELVDFIQQEQGIPHPRLCDRLNHFTRHGADVGAAVTADFAFIVHAA